MLYIRENYFKYVDAFADRTDVVSNQWMQL